MTNEEKAEKLYLNVQQPTYDDKLLADAFIRGANWKDDILREEREKAIEKFNKYYDKKLNLAIASRYLGVVFFVDKLLGEDSRDKLHCAFTTMD